MITQRALSVVTPDGTADCQLLHPAGDVPFPGVLFFADALGSRPAITEMASRIASHGYTVLVPNLFYRSGTFAPFDPKAVWSDPAERERIKALIATIDPAGAIRDIGAYLDALAKESIVRHGGVGAVGYCLGGRLAFVGAGAFPTKIAAAASIHGGGLITDAPDSPHHAIPNIRAKLYFGIADNDAGCTPEQQGQLTTELAKAHLSFQLELYPGATHGFAPRDMPPYDAVASERQFVRVLALFGEALR